MKSYLKVVCLRLCAASLALGSVGATRSEQMFSETASAAVAEYRSTQDVPVLARLIPQLSILSARAPEDAKARETLLSVGRDMLNALYETADLNFDPQKKPEINLSAGGTYSAGVDPESIRDPKMKAEYKARVEEANRCAEYFLQQRRVSDVIDDLARLFRKGFADLSAQDVNNMLTRNGMNSSNGDDFLRRMEERSR